MEVPLPHKTALVHQPSGFCLSGTLWASIRPKSIVNGTISLEPSSNYSHSMPLLLKVKTRDGFDGSTVGNHLGLFRMPTIRSAVAGPASVRVFLGESD